MLLLASLEKFAFYNFPNEEGLSEFTNMTHIYITRHGVTESNKKEIYAGRNNESLAPEGVVQAESLGKSLQSLGINRIYSSPIHRAVQTARIIGEILLTPVFVEDDLAEMELGPWTGLAEEEVSRKYPDHFYLWNTKPDDLVLPGRETLREVRNRALKVIHRIEGENSECSILAVTHVSIIRSLIIHYQKLDMNSYKSIYVPNLSVFHLQLNGESSRISKFS